MIIDDRHSLSPSQRMPRLIASSKPGQSIVTFLSSYRADIDAMLLDNGVIQFRGFDTNSVEGFQAFVDALDAGNLDYRYRSTPRKSRGRGVYTATEYPAGREIPLHNENSYQHSWPGKLAFACMIPAKTGGATTLADMRKVGETLGPDLLETFHRRGVRYDRVFHPHVDLPWQDVFQTEDRGEVARFCDANEIHHEWIDGETLRTWQISQGTIRHPILNEQFLFNQANLFHPSALGEATATQMLEIFGEEGLPRNARYGDGGAIALETLEKIRGAYNSAAFDLDWQTGDVALIDNLQVAHGRRAFTGERLVLAALLDPQGAPGHGN
ncbi:TauD/TfdA family dioxygenase [Sphingomonas sp. 1185]|uniref:TauD/TfdA family dioxygenase n=1 Tax=Sphingomonas sp. 1185 TaxID=3156411 RepID=UPI00339829F5